MCHSLFVNGLIGALFLITLVSVIVSIGCWKQRRRESVQRTLYELQIEELTLSRWLQSLEKQWKRMQRQSDPDVNHLDRARRLIRAYEHRLRRTQARITSLLRTERVKLYDVSRKEGE